LYFENEKQQYAKELVVTQRAYKQSQKRYEKLVKTFKDMKHQYALLKKEREAKEDELFVLESSYNILPLAKELGHARQKFMNDVGAELKRYHLNVSKIEQQQDKKVELVVISRSQNRSAIAKFMQSMLNKGYGSVDTSQIRLEDGVYKSLIRIQK
jgi:hypothetical protein